MAIEAPAIIADDPSIGLILRNGFAYLVGMIGNTSGGRHSQKYDTCIAQSATPERFDCPWSIAAIRSSRIAPARRKPWQANRKRVAKPSTPQDGALDAVFEAS